MSKTLFEKIIAREIPAAIVYEDDLVLAIRDINPQAPVHVLIFPKKVIPRIAEAKAEDQRLLGHILLKAAEVAKQVGFDQAATGSSSTTARTAAKPCRTCMSTFSADATWPGRRVEFALDRNLAECEVKNTHVSHRTIGKR